MTENQKLYQKQLKRIERAVKNQAKKGYTITIPDNLFQMPKRVTAKKLSEMAKLTPRKLTALYGEYTEGGVTKKGLRPTPKKPRKPRKAKSTYAKEIQERGTEEQNQSFNRVRGKTNIIDDLIFAIEEISGYNIENSEQLKREWVHMITQGIADYGDSYIQYLENASNEIMEDISEIQSGRYDSSTGSNARDLSRLLEFNDIKSELMENDEFFGEDWNIYD